MNKKRAIIAALSETTGHLKIWFDHLGKVRSEDKWGKAHYHGPVKNFTVEEYAGAVRVFKDDVLVAIVGRSQA